MNKIGNSIHLFQNYAMLLPTSVEVNASNMKLSGYTSSRLAEFQWNSLLLKALGLKRTLDAATTFDFVGQTESGTVLLLGEGNLSFAVSLTVWLVAPMKT